MCHFRCYLRIRVGHGKDDRIGCHACYHLGGKGILGRQPEQDVSSGSSFFKGSEGGVGGKEGLVGVHTFDPSFVDDPFGVAHDHVVRFYAEGDGQFGAGVGRGAGAVDDDPDVLQLLANEMQGIDKCCGTDNCGPVLIVMKDRNLHGLLQLLLDVEAFGSLDVLEVYASEGRFQKLASPDDLVRILGVQFDVEDVDIGK